MFLLINYTSLIYKDSQVVKFYIHLTFFPRNTKDAIICFQQSRLALYGFEHRVCLPFLFRPVSVRQYSSRAISHNSRPAQVIYKNSSNVQ